MASPNVFVCTRPTLRQAKLWVHFDPPSDEYLVQAQKEGACVFSEEKARRFIQSLQHPEAWTIEVIEGHIQRVSPYTEDAKRILKSLQKLPGYTKTEED